MKMRKIEKVGASIADSQANLSVLGVFQVVENAVTEHFGAWQLDNVNLKRKYNAAWVFTKNRIRRLKDIPWNGEFHTESFLSSVTNAAVHVDVAIRNAARELCAYARVEMCMLDLQTGRIRKIGSLELGEVLTTEPPEAEIAFTKFGSEALSEVGQVRVKYTCVDFSHHTNNVEYVRFILDTYSVQALEARPIREMQVSYAHQSYENDVLTIRKGCFGDKDLFLLQKEDQTIVRSEIVF